MDELIEIPLQNILLPPPVFAGMNILVIASIALAAKTSASNEHIDPPIVVDEEQPGMWRIVQGRHRFFGYVVAGRQVIRAKPRNRFTAQSGGAIGLDRSELLPGAQHGPACGCQGRAAPQQGRLLPPGLV